MRLRVTFAMFILNVYICLLVHVYSIVREMGKNKLWM